MDQRYGKITSVNFQELRCDAAVAELDKRGFQLFTHVIGDYGIGMALDGYESAEQRNRKRDRRARIENIETVAATDIP